MVQKQSEDVSPTAEARQQMIYDLMSSRGIENVTKEPPTQTEVPKVSISYESLDLDAIAKNFFGGDYRYSGGTYYSDDYTFGLVNNGSVLYVLRSTPAVKAPPITLAMAQDTAERFITESLGFDTDYYYSGTENLGDTVRLDYVQRYGDYFIDNTYMRIILDGKGIVSVERKWLEVSPVEGGTLSIIRYDDALFKAFDAIEKAHFETPLNIELIKLGYGLENTVLGTNIQSGEAMPYYRFYLSGDNYVTVPALKLN